MCVMQICLEFSPGQQCIILFARKNCTWAWLLPILTFSFSFNVLNGLVTHPTSFFHLFVLSYLLFICLFACRFIQSVIYSALYFYLLIYVSFIYLFIQLLSCLQQAYEIYKYDKYYTCTNVYIIYVYLYIYIIYQGLI